MDLRSTVLNRVQLLPSILSTVWKHGLLRHICVHAHSDVMPFHLSPPPNSQHQLHIATTQTQGGNLLYGSGRSVVIRSIADPLKVPMCIYMYMCIYSGSTTF